MFAPSTNQRKWYVRTMYVEHVQVAGTLDNKYI